jgi:hypothetical protein
MACVAALEAGHRELADRLATIDAVLESTYLDRDDSSSDYPETEIVVRAATRDTVPNAVAYAVADCGLRLAPVQPENDPEYYRVVAR